MDLDVDLDDERFAPAPAEAVIFDLGNVLLRWTPSDAVAAGLGAEKAAEFVSHPEFDFAAWNLRNDAGRSLADALDWVRANHPDLEPAAQAYVDNFEASLSPIEGSVSLLKELDEAGVPLVALTNWSAELFTKAVERYDFLDLFEDIVVSGEEGVVKPDPEIWEILAERTDHIGGLEDFLFIDDSIANVQSAVEAGLDAVQFTGPDDLREDLIARGYPVQPAAANPLTQD